MAAVATNLKATPWYRRLLGPELIQCYSACDSEMKVVPVESVLGNPDSNLEIVGLYFTPIFAMDEGNVMAKLLDLYRRVNEGGGVPREGQAGGGGRLEIVQIVLQTNVDCVVTLTDVEETFRKLVKDVPWFAVPYRDFQRKVSQHKQNFSLI
ncbi:Uncharacterized protein GBIM_10313 [Gryllus bimaculatus]|nr:Uncharacterized protein GBIM_10313 [Gryllus bimaculatus]